MLRLNITWRDRRVDYLNLRDDVYQNLIPDGEAAQMWIPEIGTLAFLIYVQACPKILH
jgi:hypothetical protein